MAKKAVTAWIKIDKLLETVDCDVVVVGDVFALSRVALRAQESTTLGLREVEV